MAIHVCHGVTFVCLLIAFALGAASLGLSFVHLKGTAAPSALKPFVAVTSELYPFKRCTDTTGNAPIYTTSKCPSWDDYWAVDTSYCASIGSTGNITTKEMLTKVHRAGVTGGLYVAGVFIHLVVFLLWAVSLIPTRFVLVPTVLISVICWCVCVAMWGEMYHACSSNYCDAAEKHARALYGLTSTECWLADGLRTVIASFLIYVGCLIPVVVLSPPTAEVAPEETKPADGAVAEKSHEPV